MLTIVLAAPEVAHGGQDGGLSGAGAAARDVAFGVAVAAGESVAVGGAIMKGAALAGTSVTTGAGVVYTGIGGAATVGGAAIFAGGAGFGIGCGIGSIPIGRPSIHEHLGAGMYWAWHHISEGASAAWNWTSDW